MKDSPPPQDHPTKKKGMFGKILDLFFRLVGVLLFSALISVLIEWIGMSFIYEESGFDHAESMMKREIGYLSSSIEGDDTNSDAVGMASDSVDVVVHTLFINSGVIDWLTGMRDAEIDDNAFISFVRGVITQSYDYIMAAIYILIMFFIRLAILVLSIPAFLLFGIVGLTDGLMQRDLRRWCGGNESGFIYHWAKRFSLPILILSWVIYLAIPSSIHPNYIITPFAILFALVIMVMASKFKKYL